MSAPWSFFNQYMVGGANDFDGSNAVVVSYDESGDGNGAVWLLSEDGVTGLWEQIGYLQSSESEQFGWGAAIRGDTLVVGAPSSSGYLELTSMFDTMWVGRGRAVVIMKDASGVWTEQAVLSPSVADSNAGFGSAIAIAGERVVRNVILAVNVLQCTPHILPLYGQIANASLQLGKIQSFTLDQSRTFRAAVHSCTTASPLPQGLE